MNVPARITKASDPAMIAFAQALARAHVARDIAALRAARQLPAATRNRTVGLNGESNADGHLRPVQQGKPEPQVHR